MAGIMSGCHSPQVGKAAEPNAVHITTRQGGYPLGARCDPPRLLTSRATYPNNRPGKRRNPKSNPRHHPRKSLNQPNQDAKLPGMSASSFNPKCFVHPDREATTVRHVPCAPNGVLFLCGECAKPENDLKVWEAYKDSHQKLIKAFKQVNPGS
jgi:hypothetical protein